jgi:L1 cell adhesion molecule
VDSILKSQLEKTSCLGTENGWNVLQHSGTYIEYLKALYDECKIVMGNLEISYLSQKDLDKAGGEHALDFLSSIEQVHGYVLIISNQITTISLPNLQIIWGDNYYTPNIDNENIDNGTTSIVQIEGHYGLFIMNNSNLKILDLRSLRAVHKELIGLYLNPYICHWTSIDYRQILGENYLNRIKIKSNFNRCEKYRLHYRLPYGMKELVFTIHFFAFCSFP